MIDYSWVPWFGELVAKIANNELSYLIEKAKTVQWGKDLDEVSLLKYRNENIDPFSFLYFLAQKNTRHQFQPVFQSVHAVFDIASELPSQNPFIPTPPANATSLFHSGGVGQPDLLWRLFQQAANKMPTIVAEDFNATLKIGGVAMAKLTQTLFIVNPHYFLPADKTNKALPWPEFQSNVENYEAYVTRMDAIKSKFPDCDPYEVNTFLDSQQRVKEPLITANSRFFHVSSKVYDDGVDYWEWNDSLGSDWKEWTFRENNIVYTGSKDNHKDQPYMVQNLKRGDIVVVHYSRSEGHGIGVVEENGYQPADWNSDASISVYWINKKTGPLEGKLGTTKFRELTPGKGPYQACREASVV